MKNKILIYSLLIIMIFTMNVQAFAVENRGRVIDPNKPMVALTFDDGPSKYTPRIIDVLNEYNSKGTFFVVGESIKRNKEILIEMIKDGHEIGNHSYNHKDLTSITEEELYRQIVGTDDLLEIYTGHRTTIMRPPYGSNNEETNKNINKPIILWSVDTLDWKNRNAEIVKNNILNNVKDGDIVLMHDLYESTAQAAEMVIPELIKRGYQLVTVSELTQYRDSTLVSGQIYREMYK
jgi:peptidoglycan/xylan/chitin deacetylase (PgdA/CDA1 family)